MRCAVPVQWFSAAAQGDVSYLRKNMERWKRCKDVRDLAGGRGVFEGFCAIHYAIYHGQNAAFTALFPHEYDELTQYDVQYFDRNAEATIPARSNCLMLAVSLGRAEMMRHIIAEMLSYTLKYDVYYGFDGAGQTALTLAMQKDYRQLGCIVLDNRALAYSAIAHMRDRDENHALMVQIIIQTQRSDQLKPWVLRLLKSGAFVQQYVSAEALRCADLIRRFPTEFLRLVLELSFKNVKAALATSGGSQRGELTALLEDFYTQPHIAGIIGLFGSSFRRTLHRDLRQCREVLQARVQGGETAAGAPQGQQKKLLHAYRLQLRM